MFASTQNRNATTLVVLITQHSIPQPDKAFLPTSSSPSRCTQHASVTPDKNIVVVSPFPTVSREQKELECPIWRRSQEIKMTRQRHHPSPVCDVPNHVRQSGTTSIGGHQEHSKQQIRAGVNPGAPVRAR